MSTFNEHGPRPSRPSGPVRRTAARVAAIAVLTLAGAAGIATAFAAGTIPAPQPRDSNGNLANQVTSTSTGVNCVTGTEPGCFTVLATPAIDPAIAGGAAAAALTGLGAAAVIRHRRHTTPDQTG